MNRNAKQARFDGAIRALIVDDEELARERLRSLLLNHPEIEIAGEAEDGEQALEKIAELEPDLVFLDIQMPGCGGMEVADSLSSPRPRIIFCTAYDQYAVDAFELNAVDYLLKPVTRARLASAIEKLRQGLNEDSDGRIEKASRSINPSPQRFLAKRGSKFRVVPRQQVLYFTSDEGLTKLVTQQQEYWVQPTLADLEKRLQECGFLRISRSSLVNLAAVREVIPLIGGHGEVAMANQARLEVSRRRFKALLEALEGGG